MFSKEHRLRKENEVKSVVKTGKSVFDPVCGIKFKKNDLDVSRFTVVAGLKVSKSAVKRTRVKRQYREIVRLRVERIKPGYDVVMLVSSKAIDLEYADKEERLMKVFKKAGLLV